MKKILSIAALLAICVGAVAVVNFMQLQAPLNDVIESDVRNDGIAVRAYYQSYVKFDTVILDLKSVSPERSPADVFRVVLQFANAMKEQSFSKLHFAYRGQSKFYIEGEYFTTLGAEYGAQNPVYTMRKFPEHVFETDGEQAFGTWTGGLLGVTARQIEDFNEFHKRWYLEPMFDR